MDNSGGGNAPLDGQSGYLHDWVPFADEATYWHLTAFPSGPSFFSEF
jgi:hypothetical protein